MKAEVAKETQLKGPITFPQERLLSYFWNLLRSEANDGEVSSQGERAAHQQQSAEVFMLLRSLVSLRLLSQARMPYVLCIHEFIQNVIYTQHLHSKADTQTWFEHNLVLLLYAGFWRYVG